MCSLMLSGIPGETADAWTIPRDWPSRSTIWANAGPQSGGRCPGCARGIQLHRDHAVGVEARVDPHQSDKAADEERGSHEEHDRKRDFRDHERAAQHADVRVRRWPSARPRSARW